MKTGMSAALPVAALMVLATLMGRGAAVAQERPYAKIGPWQILDINERGKFNRCTASITTRTGMVRIHRMADGPWAVSIPRGDIPKGNAALADIDFGRSSEQLKITADMGSRASFALSGGMIEAFKALGPLTVRVKGKTYTWQLQNTGAAMGAIEECRLKALKR